MSAEFKLIRLQALERVASDAGALERHSRPSLGWLRTVREGLGLSLRTVAKQLGISAPSLHQLERNEARGAITLGNLDRVAAALGCRVVYVLVPAKAGQSFPELAATASRDARIVADTEHSMALEAQAVGGVPDRIRKGLTRAAS